MREPFVSFTLLNEILLYLVICCCGWLAGIVADILMDERAKKNKNPLDSNFP